MVCSLLMKKKYLKGNNCFHSYNSNLKKLYMPTIFENELQSLTQCQPFVTVHVFKLTGNAVWVTVLCWCPPGRLSASGKAEGKLAVSVSWCPKTQWQRASWEDCDSTKHQLWAIYTGGKGQTELSGKPAFSLAKVRTIKQTIHFMIESKVNRTDTHNKKRC